MPHVLYNHLTHSWDQPDPDDGCSGFVHQREESPAFGPVAQCAVRRLALGAGAALAGFILMGWLAGLLVGIS